MNLCWICRYRERDRERERSSSTIRLHDKIHKIDLRAEYPDSAFSVSSVFRYYPHTDIHKHTYFHVYTFSKKKILPRSWTIYSIKNDSYSQQTEFFSSFPNRTQYHSQFIDKMGTKNTICPNTAKQNRRVSLLIFIETRNSCSTLAANWLPSRPDTLGSKFEKLTKLETEKSSSYEFGRLSEHFGPASTAIIPLVQKSKRTYEREL